MTVLAALLNGLRLRIGWAGAPAAPMAAEAPADLAVPPPTPDPRPLSRGGLLVLGLLCALLFGLRLDAPFLYDDGEARFATVVREMAQTGRWGSPQFQSHPVLKPPLVFWLMGAARAALGDNEVAARLPSAMAGVLAVLLTASLGARLFGGPAGFLAGVVLATMFQFAWIASKGQFDMPLTVFVVAAQVLLFRALHGGRARLWAGGFACVALGVMAKGLAGVVLPVGTVGLYALLTGRGRELVRPRAWLPAGAAFAAAVAYYAALGPNFVALFFFDDHVRRFLVGLDVAEPIWWYGPQLLLAALPYAGWLPFAAWDLRRRGEVPPRGVAPRAPWRGGPVLFPVCWFALWFVLISLSKGKQEQYLLPLLPPLALLMAAGVTEAARAPGPWLRIGFSAVPATVAVGSGIFLGYLGRKGFLAAAPAAAFGGLALVAATVVWGAFRWPGRRAAGAAAGTAVLTALVVITTGLPPLERARAAAPLETARVLREAAGEGAIVSYGGPYTPTPRVTFYLRTPRPLRRLETRGELDAFLRTDRTSFLLVERSVWETLGGLTPPGRPVVARGNTGRTEYVLLAPPGR